MSGVTLSFACPHCAGPLHVKTSDQVECKVGHLFTVSEVLLDQTRSAARAAWQAVDALRQRAAAARWAAADPDLYGMADPDELVRSAEEDDRSAEELQRQAQALDLTIWRHNLK